MFHSKALKCVFQHQCGSCEMHFSQEDSLQVFMHKAICRGNPLYFRAHNVSASCNLVTLKAKCLFMRNYSHFQCCLWFSPFVCVNGSFPEACSVAESKSQHVILTHVRIPLYDCRAINANMFSVTQICWALLA